MRFNSFTFTASSLALALSMFLTVPQGKAVGEAIGDAASSASRGVKRAATGVVKGTEKGVKTIGNGLVNGTESTAKSLKKIITKSDTGISARVKLAIINAGIDTESVNVDTIRDGQVYLLGYVNKEEDIAKSEEIASNVEGVKEVINRLKVYKNPYDPKTFNDKLPANEKEENNEE